MEKKPLHLICNAHLDPIYMWRLTEGIVEALSTFRTAARFCEEHEDFVFNHNEALLYEYVRTYEPELFRKIQKLVAAGKWHIMGGWYLQPDCNMPSGESLTRQIHTGRQYFKKYFDAEPTTAINFDSFGHTRGLVQLLRKSGYDSYLFCRPSPEQQGAIRENDFRWVGFDGSEVLAHRSSEHYSTDIGNAEPEISAWIPDQDPGREQLYLWGVGNHGGGPSRADLEAIYGLMDRCETFDMVHSVPEAYCHTVLGSDRYEKLQRYEDGLGPVAPGGYTTMVRIKQGHRQLENAIYLAEKMLSHASAAGLMEYPQARLDEALRDLMLVEFHDALPGSIVREAEDDVLQIIRHGREIAVRLQLDAFLALMAGQEPMVTHQIPIFVYNPHPYPVTGIFECEYGLPRDTTLGADELSRNFQSLLSEDGVIFPTVYCNGTALPSQLEQHHSHKPFEWRKRSVFYATLPAGTMSRLECRFTRRPRSEVCEHAQPDGDVVVETPELRVVIDGRTGLLTSYQVEGREFLSAPAFRPLVMEDHHDAYGWDATHFDRVLGEFPLMTDEQARAFIGFDDTTAKAVRIIEDGEVRTVVQVLLQHGGSQMCLRYQIPKIGRRIETEVIVYWNEKGRMLKLSVPTVLEQGDYLGQHAFGVQKLPKGHEEVCIHKWAGLFDDDTDRALTWGSDGGYGTDCDGGEIRISLLRSPLYLSGEYHREKPCDHNRFGYRSDLGERVIRVWLQAGTAQERRTHVDREALTWNEAPYILSLNPSGEGEKPAPFLHVDRADMIMTAVKQAEDGRGGYLLHLAETAGIPAKVHLHSDLTGTDAELTFAPYELKTLRLDAETGACTEEDRLTI